MDLDEPLRRHLVLHNSSIPIGECSECTMRKAPKWFRVPAGLDKGRWHISGWMYSSLLLGDGTWFAFSICPVCYAMIPSARATGHNDYRDRTWSHEQYHARTDFPIPEESHEQR